MPPAVPQPLPIFNISTRKVGGLRFIKAGRLCVSFCVAKSAKPIKRARPRRSAAVPSRDPAELATVLALVLFNLERTLSHAK